MDSMRLHQHSRKSEEVSVRLLASFLLIALAISSHGQTLVVRGTVSTSTTPVQNASITFIDSNDTTSQFFTLTDASGNYQIGIVTSVKSNDNLPAGFELEQNQPNPFSSATAISYRLSAPSTVQVTIYNLLGREVKTFVLGMQA